jgi:hypothetical protein
MTQVSFDLEARISTSAASARFTSSIASITISLRSPRYRVILRSGLLSPSRRRTANLIVVGRVSFKGADRVFAAFELLLASSSRIVLSERPIPSEGTIFTAVNQKAVQWKPFVECMAFGIRPAISFCSQIDRESMSTLDVG